MHVFRGQVIASFLALLLSAGSVVAAPIQIGLASVNMFRDTRGANDVGQMQGDVFQFGANVLGGSLGTTIGAIYPPTNFTDPQAPCSPLTVNANFCAGATPFNANRIAQPWTLQFERTGETTVLVTGPDLAGTSSPVPFPVNVTISAGATPTTPTISWTIPGGFTADAVRVQVFDTSAPSLPNGVKDIIYSTAVSASANAVAIPSGILTIGKNYTLNVQLIDTRGDPALFEASNSNAFILRRSNSFFDFSPIAGGTPNAFLPTVVNGVYNFSITNVGPTSVTFIDPLVAIGYDYATGDGNPNFASVLLPNVGDGQFLLEYLFGGDFFDIAIAADLQYFFPQGGVDAFRVLGIETSAGLDPDNVTAFITGLTFVSNGDFTGTMTPITALVSVPEPATLALLGIALAGLGFSRRHKSSEGNEHAQKEVAMKLAARPIRWLLGAGLGIAAPLASATVIYTATLSGAVEAPPNVSSGTGAAVVTIDDVAKTMRVEFSFSGLTGTTTASHIHCCTASPGTGTAGVATQTPTFIGFPLGVTSGSYDQTFDLTDAGSWNPAFITAHGGTVASAEVDFLAGVDAGTAYLNIHSNVFPGGEIRGFLQVPEPATLALLGVALAGLGFSRRRKLH
jgi:CHRD domain/PEP-CTERM motif